MPNKAHPPTRLDHTTDILVRWLNDGTTNVVSNRDLQYTGSLRKGSTVTMLWEGVPWEATVLAVECSEEESSDSESDLPLATLAGRTRSLISAESNGKEPPESGTRGEVSATDEPINRDDVQQSDLHAVCDSFFCQREVWAACWRCNCLLCYEHFEISEECINHNVAFRADDIDISLFDVNGNSKCTSLHSKIQDVISTTTNLTEMHCVPLQEDMDTSNATVETELSQDSLLNREQLSVEKDVDPNPDIPHEEAVLPSSSSRCHVVTNHDLDLQPEDFHVDGESLPLSPKPLGSKEGFCYLSHEGQTRRGACEVSSNLHSFLIQQDSKGVKEVQLFSDGCVGQNKNSVLPAMMMSFMGQSKSIEKITLIFFETNHGQSEGDVMHSVIECKIKQQREIFLPGQLATICRMAKDKAPHYKVFPVKSLDIKDWKTYSQRRGILRIRSSEDGLNIDWTKFMALQVVKGQEDVIFFKYSHKEESYHCIRITGTRYGTNGDEPEPQCLYQAGPPKLSQGKYEDLQLLCSGRIPVITHPDYQAFYRQLPH